MAAESLASRVDSGRDASQYEKDSYVEYAKNPRYPS
jgi:hypothetical protein